MRDDKKKELWIKRDLKTVKLIKERCDIVINLTSSGELGVDDERRQAHK